MLALFNKIVYAPTFRYYYPNKKDYSLMEKAKKEGNKFALLGSIWLLFVDFYLIMPIFDKAIAMKPWEFSPVVLLLIFGVTISTYIFSMHCIVPYGFSLITDLIIMIVLMGVPVLLLFSIIEGSTSFEIPVFMLPVIQVPCVIVCRKIRISLLLNRKFPNR